MALNLYPGEKAIVQPNLTDGKGLPVLPKTVNFPITGITWTTSDATKIAFTQNPMSDGYSAEIQAVGAVGTSATITCTAPGPITGTSVVTVVNNVPTTVTVNNVNELAPVKERPTVGPPG